VHNRRAEGRHGRSSCRDDSGADRTVDDIVEHDVLGVLSPPLQHGAELPIPGAGLPQRRKGLPSLTGEYTYFRSFSGSNGPIPDQIAVCQQQPVVGGEGFLVVKTEEKSAAHDYR
jgi:hypothetical protein